MNGLLLLMYILVVGALMIRLLRPTPRPPQVVYVPVETSHAEGLGCLPTIFIVGIIATAILYLLS